MSHLERVEEEHVAMGKRIRELEDQEGADRAKYKKLEADHGELKAENISLLRKLKDAEELCSRWYNIACEESKAFCLY